MLEWYRAHEGWESLIADGAAILRSAAEAAGTRRLVWRGAVCDAFAEPERLGVAEAFARFAGIDLTATIGPEGETDGAALAAAARGAGIATAPDDGWPDVFARVLVAKVEPRLGIGRPTVLERYPAAEAALARRTPGDPRTAERFELYACGVELANAFGELTDPVEQRRRFEADMAEKERRYGERYPIDEDFLDALGAMPPAAGAALGFDRLMALATGAPSVEAVQWAPAAGA
jgi:lysyl-tRNA synthetase class 2